MGQKGATTSNMAWPERDSDANEEDFFRNWGVEKLKSYLSAREDPIGNTNKQGFLNLAIFLLVN